MTTPDPSEAAVTEPPDPWPGVDAFLDGRYRQGHHDGWTAALAALPSTPVRPDIAEEPLDVERLARALADWLDSHGEPDIEERLAEAAKAWLEEVE